MCDSPYAAVQLEGLEFVKRTSTVSLAQSASR
jgi:hypothetical protein